jgi:glutaredoxin
LIFLAGNGDMKTKIAAFLFSMLAAAGVQAEMYKWVDSTGRVTYSDTPPPASVKKAQFKGVPSAGEDAGLPYSLATVSRDHPVTLYTSAQCAPCDEGRALLQKRGIPFAEKIASTSDDLAKMKQAGGDGRMPFLTVGRTALTGFDSSSWNGALSAAGYPESSRLPAGYRPPAAQPARITARPGCSPCAVRAAARRATSARISWARRFPLIIWALIVVRLFKNC